MCDPRVDVLERCLASVRDQDATDWEHVIVDDASTDAAVHSLLDTASADPRVRFVRRTERGGIVAASNDALGRATGDIVALLDHDDELAPHALSTMATTFDATDCDVAYSDHDLIRPDGRRADPFFKPDFSPERLRHHNYITHMLAVKHSVMRAIGGFRVGFDGAQDHDLLLRLAESTDRIVHVPDVLYHWRQVEGSVALDTSAKPYAFDNGRLAVEEHCMRMGIVADVDAGEHPGTFVVRRSASPPVSVIVAAPMQSAVVWGRRRPHLARLLDSLVGVSAAEIIIAAPRGRTDDAQRLLDDSGSIGRVVEACDASMLWTSALAHVTGDVVVPIAESMALDVGSDLGALAAHLLDVDVFVAGCPQYNSDRTVRHGGFVTDGLGTHPILAGWAASHPGPGHLMAVAREVGAVDVIGAAIRPQDFERIVADTDGPGDDALALAGFRSGVQRRSAGDRLIWSPRAAWYRWTIPPLTFGSVAEVDPYSNPNLTPGRGDWLELPGRSGAAPYDIDESGQRVWI